MTRCTIISFIIMCSFAAGCSTRHDSLFWGKDVAINTADPARMKQVLQNYNRLPVDNDAGYVPPAAYYGYNQGSTVPRPPANYITQRDYWQDYYEQHPDADNAYIPVKPHGQSRSAVPPLLPMEYYANPADNDATYIPPRQYTPPSNTYRQQLNPQADTDPYGYYRDNDAEWYPAYYDDYGG